MTLVHNALSDRAAEVVNMSIMRKHVGGSGVFNFDSVKRYKELRKAKSFDFGAIETVSVTTIRTDDLLPLIGFKKAVLKMDIEGSEHKAIRSAKKLFDQVDIEIAFLEWVWYIPAWGFRAGLAEGKEMGDFFYSRGYKAYNSWFDTKQLNDKQIDWKGDIFWKKP